MSSKRRGSRDPLPPGFGSIWTAVAVDLVGFGIVLPILPLYSERFGASPLTIGLLVASFSLAQVAFAPLLGHLSDRLGRKPVLVASMVGTALGSLVTALAPSVLFLFLGRILDGASGASVSVANAAVSDIAPREQRARLIGLLGAAFGLGFVLGPALGSLAAVAGPRAPFLLAALLAGVNAAVAQRRIPETRRPTATPPEVGGMSASPECTAAPNVLRAEQLAEVGGMSASDECTGAPNLAASRGWGHGSVTSVHPCPEPAERLRLGARARRSGALVPRTSGGGDGSASVLARLLVVGFLGTAAFSAFEATFALLGARRFGLDLGSAAAIFGGTGLVVAFTSAGLVHATVQRLGERGTVRLGLLLVAAGLLGVAVASSWWLLAPALGALAAGQGLVTPALLAAVAAVASPARHGAALGAQHSASGLARIVGPALAGLAFELSGPGLPMAAAAVVAILAVAALSGRHLARCSGDSCTDAVQKAPENGSQLVEPLPQPAPIG